MNVVSLTSGCKLLITEKMSLLFGCVSEAVKFIQCNHKVKDAPPLRGIVLPDTMTCEGVVNFAPEFPLYKYLFVDGGLQRLIDSNFADRDKFLIIGSKKQLARARTIIQITLFAPDSVMFRRWSSSHSELRRSTCEKLQQACSFFRLKRCDGASLTIDDLALFQELPVVLDEGTQIERIRKDQFKVVAADGSTEEILLDCSVAPTAPFAICPAEHVHQAVSFGVRVLSYGNGFDHSGGCTALLTWLNGVPVLVDAAPYVSEMLRAHGISPTQLGGLILTHVHDDHCGGVYELLHGSGQLRLYATAEVYESLLIKLAALLDLDLRNSEQRKLLVSYFDWRELVVGQPQQIYGVRAIAHYTAHSIPTIGVRLIAERDFKRRELLIVGDNAGFSKLDQMLDAGAINEAWHRNLSGLISGREELVIVDAGGDPAGLHADPCDPKFEQLTRQMNGRLFFGHRGAPPVGNPNLPLAKSGLFFSLDGVLVEQCDQLVVAESFAGLGVKNRAAVVSLLHQSAIREFPAGAEVISKGREAHSHAYLVIAGCLNVRDGGRLLAKLGQGDLFGEIAVLDGSPRNATVQSFSGTRLLEIPAKPFAEFVEEHGMLSKLEERWMAQRLVSQVVVLHSLPTEELDLIGKCLTSKTYDVADEIITEGQKGRSLFILSNGEVEVLRGGELVAVLTAGSVFGETTAIGASQHRTATVRCSKPSTVHELSVTDLWRTPDVATALAVRLMGVRLARS